MSTIGSRSSQAALSLRYHSTDIIDDKLVSSVEVLHQFTSVTAQLLYDILITKVFVPIQKATHGYASYLKMRKHRCVHNRVLRRKTVLLPKFCGSS